MNAEKGSVPKSSGQPAEVGPLMEPVERIGDFSRRRWGRMFDATMIRAGVTRIGDLRRSELLLEQSGLYWRKMVLDDLEVPHDEPHLAQAEVAFWEVMKIRDPDDFKGLRGSLHEGTVSGIRRSYEAAGINPSLFDRTYSEEELNTIRSFDTVRGVIRTIEQAYGIATEADSPASAETLHATEAIHNVLEGFRAMHDSDGSMINRLAEICGHPRLCEIMGDYNAAERRIEASGLTLAEKTAAIAVEMGAGVVKIRNDVLTPDEREKISQTQNMWLFAILHRIHDALNPPEKKSTHP